MAIRYYTVTWDQLHRDAKALAWRLVEKGPWKGMIAITRGGLIPCAIISRELECRLIETVLDHPAAANQTFLVSDGSAISTRTLLQRMAADQGRSLTLLPVPPALLALPLKLAGKGAMASQLLGDLEVDIAHTRQTLDWAP